jgi:DNA-binding protein HU-beta
MIKKQLSRLVAADIGIKEELARTVINLFIQLTIEKLSSGGPDARLQILGFGTFVVKKRKGRVVKIPLSLKQIYLDDVNVIKFIPGKKFLQKLND